MRLAKFMTAFVVPALLLFPGAAFAQDMSAPADVTRYVLDSTLLIAGGLAGLVAIAGLALRDVGLARTQNAPQVWHNRLWERRSSRPPGGA